MWTVGIKSYGGAPTFLLLTGYEQVRSVVAALAGELAAADDVRLVLPETGVCSTRPVIGADDSAGWRGVADTVAKDKGKAGCECRAAA